MQHPLWSKFCLAHERPESVSFCKWSTWRRGKSQPAIPKIAHWATVFGVSEATIIFHCGHDTDATTQVALQAKRHEAQLAADNARRNERYRADEDFRAKTLATHALWNKARNAANPAPGHIHNLMVQAMTPEERAVHRKTLKRTQRQKHGHRWNAERAAKKAANTPPQIVQQRQAEQDLRDDIRTVKDLLKTVAALRRHLNTEAGKRGHASKKAWAAADPDGFREWQLTCWKKKDHARDARIKNLPGSWTNEEWWAEIVVFGGACAYCYISRKDARRAGHDLEFDHIINVYDAASRNDMSNCAPACKTCNSSKGDKDLLEWALETGRTIHQLAVKKYWNIYEPHLGRPGRAVGEGYPTDFPLAEDRRGPDGAGPGSVEDVA